MTAQRPILPTDLDDRVRSHVADVLGVDPAAVGPTSELAELGLSSVQILALLGDLEDEFGVVVDPEAVLDVRTPRALAEHLRSLGDVPGTAA